jgi:hypothetical protein
LSVDQRPFHAAPLGHYARLSSLLAVCGSQSSPLVPLHSIRVMSTHPEGTIGRLRYSLGGDRPSQTTRLALSGRRLHGRPLDASPRKSGISPVPPPPPQGQVLRLPPILRRPGLAPRPGCSKAPRGLFVLSRVTRIFTGTSISPSPRSRQCSSRYAFRAGRNLPDKEFRSSSPTCFHAGRTFPYSVAPRLPSKGMLPSRCMPLPPTPNVKSLRILARAPRPAPAGRVAWRGGAVVAVVWWVRESFLRIVPLSGGL